MQWKIKHKVKSLNKKMLIINLEVENKFWLGPLCSKSIKKIHVFNVHLIGLEIYFLQIF